MILFLIYVKPLFTYGYHFSDPKNRDLSVEIDVQMCIIGKSKNIHSKKTIKSIFYGSV